MIKYKKGNLVTLTQDGAYDVVLHGLNCHQDITSGIAFELSQAFPEVGDADTRNNLHVTQKLGSFIPVLAYANNKNVFIVNCYTKVQDTNCEDNTIMFDYEAFENILKKVSSTYQHEKIGMPLMGSGTQGTNRDKIIEMIETHLHKNNVDIVLNKEHDMPEQYHSFGNKIKCLVDF